MTIKRNQPLAHSEDPAKYNSSVSVQYTISDAEVRELNEIHYMLDTDICSYIIRNRPSVVRKRFRQALDRGVCISDITLAELCYGVENHPNRTAGFAALLAFLGLVKIIPFGSLAAEDYGKISVYLRGNGTPIGAMDTLIAAHARSTNLVLVTNNTRHYSIVPNLLLENWAA